MEKGFEPGAPLRSMNTTGLDRIKTRVNLPDA
jgi:hypothetical protein